jgi:hypothetical protein
MKSHAYQMLSICRLIANSRNFIATVAAESNSQLGSKVRRIGSRFISISRAEMRAVRDGLNREHFRTAL